MMSFRAHCSSQRALQTVKPCPCVVADIMACMKVSKKNWQQHFAGCDMGYGQEVLPRRCALQERRAKEAARGFTYKFWID